MRRLLRPILLEFCRTHLILTAATALLTVLFLTVCTLLGLTDATAEGLFLPIRTAADGRGGMVFALIPTGLGLLAYLPAGRFTRKRNLLPRPDVEEALLLLLVPAAAFWLLLALAYLVPYGTGLLVAALLLSCPAYGSFTLLSQLLGCLLLAGLHRRPGHRSPPSSPLPGGQLPPHRRPGPGGGNGRRIY